MLYFLIVSYGQLIPTYAIKSNIVLLSIGIMILFCALVSRILIASEIQSVQIRAAHLVAGKINAQLSQRVSSEFKANEAPPLIAANKR